MKFFVRGFSLYEKEVKETKTKFVFYCTIPLITICHLIFLNYLPIVSMVIIGLLSFMWISMDIRGGLLTTIYYLCWWGMCRLFVNSNESAWIFAGTVYIITWLIHLFVYVDSEGRFMNIRQMIATITVYPLYAMCQIGFMFGLLKDTQNRLREYRTYDYDEYNNLISS